MQNRFKILLIHPIAHLFQFKSFSLVILLLCLADRTIKLIKGTYHLNLKLPPFWRVAPDVSAKLLFTFPGMIVKQMGNPRVMAILLGIFFAKKILLLWPNSDMRRMHLRQRTPWAPLTALGAIRPKQLLWYVLAQGAWCAAIGALDGIAYTIGRWGWHYWPSQGWLWGFGLFAALMIPLALAGFSFSSKLALNAMGTFWEKGRLLLKVISNWPIAWRAWLFFLAWIVVEALFIAGTTIFILAKIRADAVRFIVAALLDTPFYAYLEMAAFKLFLLLYQRFELVRQEYECYYRYDFNL